MKFGLPKVLVMLMFSYMSLNNDYLTLIFKTGIQE